MCSRQGSNSSGKVVQSDTLNAKVSKAMHGVPDRAMRSLLSEAYLGRLPDEGQGEDFRLIEEGDV